MKKRRKSAPDGGGNWMDTYGDMVTLLLTFFVMLYAMSSLNQQKWEVFVKSIYPDVKDQEQIAINEHPNEGTYDVSGTMQTNTELPENVDINKLYLTLAQRLEEYGVSGATVSRGENYTFIQFQDQAFFDGESSVLTAEAKSVLDIFCDTIAPEADQIGQIQVMGHTSQGDPNRPNNPRTDRMLSSLRSAEVSAYIQEKNIIDPGKLVGVSYGQFRPVATFETREGRAENRRVEILLIDADSDTTKSLNDYYEEVYNGANADKTIVTGGDGFTAVESSPENVASLLPESSASAEQPHTVSDQQPPAGEAPE